MNMGLYVYAGIFNDISCLLGAWSLLDIALNAFIYYPHFYASQLSNRVLGWPKSSFGFFHEII